MSWNQGLQERDTLPPKFLAWADAQGEKRGWGELEYITWFDPDVLFLDYGENTLKMDFAGTKWSVKSPRAERGEGPRA